MRFGLIHRIMTNALATLGVLAIVSTTAMTPWARGFVLVGLALALAIPEAWQSRPALRQLATVGPLTLFVVEGVRIFAGYSAIDVAIEFAAVLQVLRLATRRGAAHDQQVIVLALLHFVAGTVLGGGLAYAACFLGFVIVAPGALVLSHLRREVEGNYRQGARDRTGLPVDVPRILRSRRVIGRGFLTATCLLSVPIVLFTISLFIVFPRVGLSLLMVNHHNGDRMIGFSDRVDLGEVGAIRDVPQLALRFDVEDLPEPRPERLTLRLRGTAFDRYDGHRWERTRSREAANGPTSSELLSIARPPDRSRDRKVTIDLEPIDPPVVFLPPRTVAVQLRTQQQAVIGPSLVVYQGPEGEVRYRGESDSGTGLRYEAYVAGERELLFERLPLGERARYLELPGSTPSRIGLLAREWTEGLSTPFQKAKAIEEHLKRDYRYDLGSPSGGKEQPVDHFLFESRRGHCEFFSTSMALMLRELGIPSRNVTGFVGGTYNRFGRYYAVRQGDAHSWVEAYLDEPVRAWVTFDPTPTSGAQPLQATSGTWVYLRDIIEAISQRWNRNVLGYDLKTQERLFDGLRRRYVRFRADNAMDTGALGTLTKPKTVALALLVLAPGIYLAWRHRRAARNGSPRAPKGTRDARRLDEAIALYRLLEGALAVHGIARPMGLPPLRHAEQLVEQDHPLGDEVLELTQRYLDARFGGIPIDEPSKHAFERRVKDLRQFKVDHAT